MGRKRKQLDEDSQQASTSTAQGIKKERNFTNVKLKTESNEIIEEYVIEELVDDTNNYSSEVIDTGDGQTIVVHETDTIVEHVCGKCKRVFTNFDILQAHLEECRFKKELPNPNGNKPRYYSSYPKQRKVLCFCCDEEKIIAHVGHIPCPYNNDPYNCTFKFSTELGLEKHIFQLHSVTEEFKCEKCNVTCPTKGILDMHNQTHSSAKPYECTSCGRDFTRKYHLERHLNHSTCVGSKVKKELPCAVCGKKFSRTDNLREHLRFHMGDGVRKRDFKCPHCEKSFYGSSLLNIHIRTHTGEKPFPCDVCEKSFSSTGALRKHRRLHTGEKPYVCSICSVPFTAKETLNRHMKIHTGERPHKCHLCDKRYIQLTQLKAHLFHHTGENGFECHLCNRVFAHKNKLQAHILYIHQGKKPLSCELCSKTFVSQQELRHHVKLHNGVKEFECDVCQKSFATKATLIAHLKIHTQEQPCMCELCQKTFKRFDCLVRHVRQFHRNTLFEIITDAEKQKLKIVSDYMVTPIPIAEEEDEEENEKEILLEEQTQAGEYNNDDDVEEVFDDTNEDNEDNEDRKEDIIHLNTSKESTDKSNSDSDDIVFMDDETLIKSVSELLNLLVDEETLSAFGWPNTSVEKVLSAVIKRCGHVPADYRDCSDYTTKMRENTKLLFTVVIDDDAIKSLLNNHTIDEVILRVLKMAKLNE